MLGVLTVEIDPQGAGFEAQRLLRVDRHYARYVDEGKLAGGCAVLPLQAPLEGDERASVSVRVRRPHTSPAGGNV